MILLLPLQGITPTGHFHRIYPELSLQAIGCERLQQHLASFLRFS